MIDPTTLAEYVDEYVNVVFIEDGHQRSVDGTVLKAAPFGIFVRPKGRRGMLIEIDSIETLTRITDLKKLRRIKLRYLDPVTDASIRQHLADRHGFVLSEIPLDPDQALMVHDGLDHGKLGHRHETLADRAAALDDDSSEATDTDSGEVEDEEKQDPDCQHYGIECEGNCNCTCTNCSANEE